MKITHVQIKIGKLIEPDKLPINNQIEPDKLITAVNYRRSENPNSHPENSEVFLVFHKKLVVQRRANPHLKC